jgi:hypothetical protein
VASWLTSSAPAADRRGASEPDLPWSLPVASWELAGCTWPGLGLCLGLHVCLGLQLRARLLPTTGAATLSVATWRRVWWLGSCVWGRMSRRRQVCRGTRSRWRAKARASVRARAPYVMSCYATDMYSMAAGASDSEQEQQDMNSKTLGRHYNTTRRRRRTHTGTGTRTRTAE